MSDVRLLYDQIMHAIREGARCFRFNRLKDRVDSVVARCPGRSSAHADGGGEARGKALTALWRTPSEVRGTVNISSTIIFS